jgi:PilZ domain
MGIVQPERRAWIRYPSRSSGSLQVLESETQWGWWAGIEDASLGGLALLLPRRMAPGTVLVIDGPPRKGEQTRALSMRVIHATPHASGRWRIGCKFDEALSERELRALLQPSELREPTRPMRIMTQVGPENAH